MRHGFIREQKDIKYLIMFSLSFFPFAITEGDLLDVVLIDDAFGYFEFSEAFSQLLEAKYVGMVMGESQKEYFLTPSGQELLQIFNMELPLTVRDKAEKAALRVLLKVRRDASIRASHKENEDGTFTVQLKVCDKKTDQLSIEMAVVTQRQCAIIEDHFKRGAERIYKEIIKLLSTDGMIE